MTSDGERCAPAGADRTVGIDDLLESILTLEPGAQSDALQAMCSAHPHLAGGLRERYRALAEFGLLAGGGDDDGVLPDRIGDFTLLERIGGGGMGVVYRARQDPLGREVALKLVRPDLVCFEQARQRFHREAEAVARLDHPGIVPVHTVGEAGGIPFLAMPMIAGCSLAELSQALWGLRAEEVTTDLVAAALAAVGGCDQPPAWCRKTWPRAVATMGLHVAEALAHAHGRGVVHRDIKPGNVMLARDGRVLLVDFGLAVADGAVALTRSGVVMGSLAYASPEQVRGERTDPRTDVFSLGAVLYELLALQAPFAVATSAATMQRVLDVDPPLLWRVNGKVDRDLAAIVHRALEKDPRRRYPDIAAMAADLRAWLAGSGLISARPDTALRRARRWLRRHPLRATAVALGLVAGTTVIGSVGYWLAMRRPLLVGMATLQQQAVEREVMLGFVDLARERRDDARNAFTRALALDRGSAEAAAGLAVLQTADGGARAVSDLAGAAPDALFGHATALLFGRSRDDKAAAREAMVALGAAIVRSRVARPVYHFQWLAAAAIAGDDATVREASAAVASLWPESPFAHYWIGYGLLQLDPVAAAASLRTALALDPAFTRARADLGVALLQAGDAQGAVRALDAVVAAEPGNARAWIDLGIARERGGDQAAAVAALRRAVASEPDLPGAHYNLARALAEAGDRDGALASYRSTIGLAEDYAEAHYNAGLLYLDADAAEPAIAHLRRAAELRPDWSEARRALGYACARAGDDVGALAAYRALVRLLPSDAEVHEYLCQLLERADDAGALAAEKERWRAVVAEAGR